MFCVVFGCYPGGYRQLDKGGDEEKTERDYISKLAGVLGKGNSTTHTGVTLSNDRIHGIRKFSFIR